MENLDSAQLINYGNSLCEKNPFIAQKLISKGIILDPSVSTSFYNLGISLHMQRRPEAAIKAYKQSLLIPGGPTKSTKANLAQDLLLNGNFKEGWKMYESRFKRNQNDYFRHHLGEPWSGPGKDSELPENLLLVGEQGFGDTIQFFRFAILMGKLGIKITLFCHEKLIPLLESNSHIDKVVQNISFDNLELNTKWCPLLSMPIKLKINSYNIPYYHSYIKANIEIVNKWKDILIRKNNNKLIGIYWQGNPEFENNIYSRGRSMHFNDLINLPIIKNIEFVSLQKGIGQKQLDVKNRLPFVKGQASFDASLDFRDTSAVIAQCDLIITTDSVIAHLSGAMGIETWVAIKWIPEWRWGLHGDKTKWYPSITLFRQPSAGDWASVINTINKKLIKKYNNWTSNSSA